MPTRCTEVATCSCIRNRWPVRTCAGRPDKPDRTSGLPPAPLRLPRSPISPKPDYASVPLWGLAAAIRLQFRLGGKIRVFRAISIPAGSARLALPVAGKTAIAASGAEIAALDAEREILRRGRDDAGCRDGAAHHQCPDCPPQGILPFRLPSASLVRKQTRPGAWHQFTFGASRGLQ